MIKKENLIFLVVLHILLVTGCKENKMEFKITEHSELTGIASASGIEATKGGIFVIGDNSPYLFSLNLKMEMEEKILLFSGSQKPDSLFEKLAKPDLEALTISDETGQLLYAFGSGSKSPERDILIEIDLQNPGKVKEYPLKEFYRELRSQAQLPPEFLNIEAAVIFQDELLLFNRGENLILKYSLSAFKKYLDGPGPIPKPQIFRIILPNIKGITAGFSGAAINPGNETIIFTATVEDTSNWIDDGEVMGSFLGVIPFKELQDQFRPECVAIGTKDRHLPIKVESVTVLPPYTKTKSNLILVTDSDGGVSEYLRGELTF
ncbi:MAG: hypothetical protein ABJ092_09230 [Gillisia sp.]